MTKSIYIIAGEASGDFLGAQLISALGRKDNDLVFHGIGGNQMTATGLNSLFPMQELSVMGISEVLPKIPHLLKRINQTVDDIIAKQPDVVVTIDAPDFSFRVHKKLRQKMSKPPRLLHYVAPTVWAWRPKRAKKIAAFLDGLICLFDFEPPFFEKEGLTSIAVGHPMMESGLLDATAIQIGASETTKLGLFFGSRLSEVKRHADIFLQIAKRLEESHRLEFIVPTLPHIKPLLEDRLSSLSSPCHLLDKVEDKWAVFKGCDAALAVSGTVGLELAMAGVPHVIGYRMNPVTWQIVKRLVKTNYAHLANIMADDKIVPEFIQDRCNVDAIYGCLNAMLVNPKIMHDQREQFDIIRSRLGTLETPSDKAADFILHQMV